jgi:hypothetical protein
MSRISILCCAITLSSIGLLAGCGGGGGGGAAPVSQVSTLSFPIEAVLVTLSSTAHSFVTYATDASGNNYQLSYSSTPGADKIVSALSTSLLKSYSISVLLKKNGVSVSATSGEGYYTLSPYLFWGSVNSSNDWIQATKQTNLPSTSIVGTSGAFFSGSIYYGNNKLLPEPVSVTWSLEADTSTTAWLCQNSSIATYSGTIFEARCFKTNQSGDISGFKSDITTSGTTLSFR